MSEFQFGVPVDRHHLPKIRPKTTIHVLLWLTLLALVLMLMPQVLSAQSGDALYGKEMLEVRQCTSCHSVAGEGGGSAPDLGQPNPKDVSPAAVAAAMWNHAPEMWEQMKDKGVAIPMLTWQDVANLYAYMYSVRYFDPPGQAEHGLQVFQSKDCQSCHALKPSGTFGAEAPPAPPISTWLAMADPVSWMQQMWNHGAGMGEQIESKAGSWPEFSLQEMVDLLAYLETVPELGLVNPGLAVGDWSAGAYLFESKSCGECHSMGQEEGKIDLIATAREEPRLTGLAVKMWNHRPAMEKAAAEKGLEMPELTGNEMSNLLAYLFNEGYFEVRGDATSGAAVYEEKGCASCHETGEGGAQPIHGKGAPFSVARLAASVWLHGPAMKTEMSYQDKEWPVLSEKETADLIEYLNTY